MSRTNKISIAAHAGASLIVAGSILFVLVSLIAGVAAEAGAKIGAIKARAESVKALEARLTESRGKTREELAAIGASPRDIASLSSPEAAKALIADACAVLAQNLAASCAFEETPITSSMSSHRARLTATAPLTEIVAGMKAAVSSPIFISELIIRPGVGKNFVQLSAVIAVVGARSNEGSS